MRREIRSLNMLRGLAALIVVVSHYSNETNLLGAVLGYGGGQMGVMLFFLLSGFLMAHLYGERALQAATLRRFAVARFARVVPLFVLIVLVSWAARRWELSDVFFTIWNGKWLLSHLLFLNGVDILWTIPPEIHFYLLFPLLWWLGRRYGRSFFIALLALVVLLLLADPPAPRFRLFGLPGQLWLLRTLPFFLTGVLLGHLYANWQPPAVLRNHLFILCLPLLLLLYPRIMEAVLGISYWPWQDNWVLLPVALIFFGLVFLVPDGNPVLENPVGDFLGRISYSLYLTHVPLLLSLREALHGQPWLGAPLYLGAAVLVAWCSYRLVELPARTALRRLGGS